MESNESHNIEKLKFEKEILQREKETAELKAALQKMKSEKEKLEKDLQMEKLKSENALFKAEKRFEADVKALSDRKRDIEEELEAVKSKRAKLDEENANAMQNLKEESILLKQRNASLESEKTRLENLLKENNQEKEVKNYLPNELNVDRSFEAVKKRTTSKHKTLNNENANQIPRSLMGPGVSGDAMTIFERTFCFSYQCWYKDICESPFETSWSYDYLMIKEKGFPTTDSFSVNINRPFDRIKCVKLLHTKDNRKAKDLEFAKDSEWRIKGLTEEYLYNNAMFIVYAFLKPAV